MSKIYCAGHCLTKGSQYQRNVEKEELAHANPNNRFYVPHENKEINDKATANPEGLAERIVKHDTDAIFWSDTVVIEPLPEALGTHVELGQLKGMKDVAERINSVLNDGSAGSEVKLQLIKSIVGNVLNRKIYPHYEDIRRFNGVTESGDRRSLGINQYVYGVCLDLSNGKGFYEWNEILEEMRDEGTKVS